MNKEGAENPNILAFSDGAKPPGYPKLLSRPVALPAGFHRYLTKEVGQDIIRASGHRPCVELANPLRCGPA